MSSITAVAPKLFRRENATVPISAAISGYIHLLSSSATTQSCQVHHTSLLQGQIAVFSGRLYSLSGASNLSAYCVRADSAVSTTRRRWRDCWSSSARMSTRWTANSGRRCTPPPPAHMCICVASSSLS